MAVGFRWPGCPGAFRSSASGRHDGVPAPGSVQTDRFVPVCTGRFVPAVAVGSYLSEPTASRDPGTYISLRISGFNVVCFCFLEEMSSPAASSPSFESRCPAWVCGRLADRTISGQNFRTISGQVSGQRGKISGQKRIFIHLDNTSEHGQLSASFITFASYRWSGRPLSNG